MTLRTKLLVPTLLAIFLGFSSFAAFQIVGRDRKANTEMKEDMENLTDLVTIATMSYVWNYDNIGLQQSVEALLRNPQVVGIEILDADGISMAKAEEDAPPTLFTRESVILRDGQVTGRAMIVFTDHYIRAGTQDFILQMVVL